MNSAFFYEFFSFKKVHILVLHTIKYTKLEIIKPDITSTITCCLTKSVDITIKQDKIDITHLYLLLKFLHPITENINKNEIIQCILGKQFITGVSIK